ncbi:MAG: glutamate--cysteine ligase, partial [Burkholderiaceae bacterium]
SLAHAAGFRARPPSAEEQADFAALAQASLAEQERMEEADRGSSFDDYIIAYGQRTPAQLCQCC